MPCYSQGVRAAVSVHHGNRTGFCMGRRLPDALFTRSRFCLAPSGEGWGDRLVRAMAAECVPLIIQDSVRQPFDDLLPYDRFSVRLKTADIPMLHRKLARISEAQHTRLRAGVRRFATAFDWSTAGHAYELARYSLCLRAGVRGCDALAPAILTHLGRRRGSGIGNPSGIGH